VNTLYWLAVVVLAGATGWHQGKKWGYYWHPAECRKRRLERVIEAARHG
jgi:hypothetical protein